MTTEPVHKIFTDAFRTLLPYTQLGWQLLAVVLIFFGIGYGLDAWLELSPTLTVICSILGVLVAVVQFVKQAGKMFQEK